MFAITTANKFYFRWHASNAEVWRVLITQLKTMHVTDIVKLILSVVVEFLKGFSMKHIWHTKINVSGNGDDKTIHLYIHVAYGNRAVHIGDNNFIHVYINKKHKKCLLVVLLSKRLIDHISEM